MKKSELKTGMVVETKEGNKYVVIIDGLYGSFYYNKTGHNSIDKGAYDDDLKHDVYREMDIVRVFTLKPSDYVDKKVAYLFKPNKFDDLIDESTHCIWDRDEVEMTLSEIEKALGVKKIKIVEENTHEKGD